MDSGAGNGLYGGAGDLYDTRSTGGGDPIGFYGLRDGVYVVGSEFLWYPGDRNDRTRQASPLIYSQQGGSLVDLISTLGPWPDGEYNVQLLSVLGATYPNLSPGAESAIEGRRDRLPPLFGNSLLRFAVPRCPIGVYTIRIRFNGLVMDLHNTIRTVPPGTSTEANRIRSFFNAEIYYARGPTT